MSCTPVTIHIGEVNMHLDMLYMYIHATTQTINLIGRLIFYGGLFFARTFYDDLRTHDFTCIFDHNIDDRMTSFIWAIGEYILEISFAFSSSFFSVVRLLHRANNYITLTTTNKFEESCDYINLVRYHSVVEINGFIQHVIDTSMLPPATHQIAT
ncbi:hypothetical protein ACJX0J_012283, partial [Zea mays]